MKIVLFCDYERGFEKSIIGKLRNRFIGFLTKTEGRNQNSNRLISALKEIRFWQRFLSGFHRLLFIFRPSLKPPFVSTLATAFVVFVERLCKIVSSRNLLRYRNEIIEDILERFPSESMKKKTILLNFSQNSNSRDFTYFGISTGNGLLGNF